MTQILLVRFGSHLVIWIVMQVVYKWIIVMNKLYEKIKSCMLRFFIWKVFLKITDIIVIDLKRNVTNR